MLTLWWSAYMQVVPNRHTLTATVSMAWTISRPVVAYVYAWEHAQWAVGPHTDCCIPVKSAIVT